MKKTTANLRAFRVISLTEWRQYKNTTRHHHHHWTSPVHAATNPYILRDLEIGQQPAVLYCKELFLHTQYVCKRTSFTDTTSRGKRHTRTRHMKSEKQLSKMQLGKLIFQDHLLLMRSNTMRRRRGGTSQWGCSYCNCCPEPFSLSVPSNENTDMSFVICWSISQNRARQTITEIRYWVCLEKSRFWRHKMMMISGLVEFDFLLIAWQDPSMINRIALIMERRASLFVTIFKNATADISLNKVRSSQKK